MKVVEKFARIENCWYDDDKWDHQKVSILWSKVAHTHLFRKYANSLERSRVDSLSWATILKHMIKKGAFKKSRAECNDDATWSLSIYNNQ